MLIINKIPEKTKSATMPVVLAEAKKQLNIEQEFTDDDDYITSLIPAAVAVVEGDINSDILETTNIVEVKPDCSLLEIQVMQSPLISLTKVETRAYKTAAYVEVAAGTYETEKNFSNFRITFDERQTAYKIKLTFTTGYATADVPEILKQAIKLKITDMYDNERQGYTMPTVVKNTAYANLISKQIRSYW